MSRYEDHSNVVTALLKGRADRHRSEVYLPQCFSLWWFMMSHWRQRCIVTGVTAWEASGFWIFTMGLLLVFFLISVGPQINLITWQTSCLSWCPGPLTRKWCVPPRLLSLSDPWRGVCPTPISVFTQWLSEEQLDLEPPDCCFKSTTLLPPNPMEMDDWLCFGLLAFRRFSH